MAGDRRLLQVLAAAGRARAAAVAMGRRRCPLPRQPLGAHQAVLGLGCRAVTPPSSFVSAFSTNAVEGEGEGESEDEDAAMAGGKGASSINGRSADADAAAHKTKSPPFDPLGTGNDAEAEEDAEVGAGEMAIKVRPFGATAEEEGRKVPGNIAKEEDSGKGAGDINMEEEGGEGPGGIDKEEQGGGKGAGDFVTEEKGGMTTLTAACFYDDPGLKAFMKKLIDEKTVDSALYVPGLTETLEHHRIKHSKERLHGDVWYFVLTLVAVVVELVLVAVFELYMQSGWEKEGNEEKQDEEEALDENKA